MTGDEIVHSYIGMVLPPMRAVGKDVIHDQVDRWLLSVDDADVPPAEVYVWLRQVQEAVEHAQTMLKARAFDSIGTRFHGEHSGEVMGHKVNITYRTEWQYDDATQDRIDSLKAEIKKIEKIAQAEGTAKKNPAGGVIRISLMP